MNAPVRVSLLPLGTTLQVEPGTPLRDLLHEYGVEFPCGGKGRCKGCRVKILDGSLECDPDIEPRLDREQLRQGWRQACLCRVSGPVSIEVAQWETVILVDHQPLPFVAGEGYGVVVDLGTTTLVAQLLDRRTGKTLAVRTGINPQAEHGSDVMSRVQFALEPEGRRTLLERIRGEIGGIVASMIGSAGIDPGQLGEVVLVGNTVMHHLFCGIDPEPLSRYPFEPVDDGMVVLRPVDLSWNLPGTVEVSFLPCLGGFVGSDVLAGIIASRIPESDSWKILLDLGTNGEIVIGNRDRILCASTAAGPAFEGGRISMGMRAATGAVSEVKRTGAVLDFRVLGNVAPRGICGSGLVDAVAVALDLGAILPDGRLAGNSDELPLVPPVKLTGGDIRELQLAKGAIAAGIRILMERAGVGPGDVDRVYLAGAFGNYVNVRSARRIGLLDFPEQVVEPVGNAALLGAKTALLAADGREETVERVLEQAVHVPLAADPEFQEIFVREMGFPGP